METNKINEVISHLGDKGNISDGSHTFNDLYYQRAVLFAVICNSHKNSAWKSWKHGDGTKNKDYFVAGVNTPEGHFNYYFHKDYWELFRVEELKVYHECETPEDVTRLMSLPDDLNCIFKYAMSISFFMGNIDDLLEDLKFENEITERQISNIERKLKVIREYEVGVKKLLGVEE